MNWNNGYEKRRFEQRMKRQNAKFRKLGMTEEQIQAIHDYDLEIFLSDRRFAEHNQPLEPVVDDMENDLQCPLLKFFSRELTTELESDQENRFWWIEEVEDEHLLRALSYMDDLQKEILTLIAFENMTQTEAGKYLAKSQPAIARCLKKIREILLGCGFGLTEGGCDNAK